MFLGAERELPVVQSIDFLDVGWQRVSHPLFELVQFVLGGPVRKLKPGPLPWQAICKPLAEI